MTIAAPLLKPVGPADVPVVYLDSQDYSRFGDVLRGASKDDTLSALFLDLVERKNRGEVIFAISMPVLAELFQYNADFRDTSFKKAEAVEQLCGKNALAHPARLVGAEILTAAAGCGMLDSVEEVNLLSSDRYWFPSAASSLIDLKKRIQTAIDEKLADPNLGSRKQRRFAKRAMRNFDPVRATQEAAPEFAETFDIPVEVVVNSLVPYLKNKIDAEEASRRLFSAFAHPAKFIEAYFEKIETDRSLPFWISKFGKDFHALVVRYQMAMQPLLGNNRLREIVDSTMHGHGWKIGQAAMKFGEDGLAEFGIEQTLIEKLCSDENLFMKVPACHVVGSIVPTYLKQILGLMGPAAKIEESAGGDLVHFLYLPHVDIWRSDKRFSVLVRNSLPEYAERVVSKLVEVPAAIDRFHAG